MKSKLNIVFILSLFFLICEKGWLKKIIYPPGCTDNTACNYNPDAPHDDGSCLFIDCLDECGGDAVEDNCGVCDEDLGNNCPVDYDGNIYQTIQIGDQKWMSENLKTTHYQNGDVIPNLISNNDWINTSSGAYSDYDNNPSNSNTYGRLYNWYTVDDDRGICPVGWHIPSDEEYKELEMCFGMSQSEADDTVWRGTNEGSKLAGNADLWSNGNLEQNTEFGTSGFSVFPAGYRFYNNGNYTNMATGTFGLLLRAIVTVRGTGY
jgi:uncharacterized protein (TIGR02145 family)